MADVSKPTSVRECLKFIGAGNVAGVSPELTAQCAKIGVFCDAHPFMGGIIQNIILRHYERQTGKVGAIDWAAILLWIQNGGLTTLFQVIMSLIAIFGA